MSETTTKVEQVNKALLEKEGKYLTFALGHEEYGLEILKVREIIGYMDITAVPQTPAYVKGVINLRGQVIPVIDLRAKFGMETAEPTEETCIIVVEITQDDRNISTGIVVDHVSEVLDIAGEDIEKAPQFGSSVNTDFILGMGKIEESVKILLDIDKVLANTDFSGFSGAGDSQPSSKQEVQAEQAKAPEQTEASAETQEPEQAQQEQPQDEQEQLQDENAGDNPQ
jgi:purine-binding chemotaxis protein CheW